MSWQPCDGPDCIEAGGDSPILLSISGRKRDLGGFEVRRILPSAKRRMVGPFIFFDEMGPAAFDPGTGIDVRPHPHIGLATVTYLFDGEIEHRDSLGIVQSIRPGAVNLMTAGNGIVHSERTGDTTRAQGGPLHGIQSWLALPVDLEEIDPAFDHFPARDLPLLHDATSRICVIIGEAFGQRSPVKTYSETFYVEAQLEAYAQIAMPDYEERAVYVVSGSVGIGARKIDAGTMIVLKPGASVRIVAESKARIMLLGGAAIPEPRHMFWNFVSSREDRIEQAKADWKGGKFAMVPGDDEFIPLPEG